MANDSRSDKIQASVAAALSRLRGDLTSFTPKAEEDGAIAERREPHFTHERPEPASPLERREPQISMSASPVEDLTNTANEMSEPEIRSTPMESLISPKPEAAPSSNRENESRTMAFTMEIPAFTVQPPAQALAQSQIVLSGGNGTGEMPAPTQQRMMKEQMPEPMTSIPEREEPKLKQGEPPMPMGGENRGDNPPVLRAEPLGMPGFNSEVKQSLMDRMVKPEPTFHPSYQTMQQEEMETPTPVGGLAMDPLSMEPVASGPKMPKLRYLLVLMLLLGAFIGIASFWLSGDDEVEVITADTQGEKVKPSPDQANQVPNQDIQILDSIRSPGDASQSSTEILTPPPLPAGDGGVSNATSPVVQNAPEQAPAASTPASADNAAPLAPAATQPAAPAPAIPSAPPAPIANPSGPVPANDNIQAAAPITQAEVSPATTEPSAPLAVNPAAIKPVANSAELPTTKPATKPASNASTKPVAGKNSIQIGAVKSEDLAAKEWLKLQKSNRDVLGKLTYRTEKVEKGSNVLYRILGGPFADKASAQQACAKLKSRGTDCIVH